MCPRTALAILCLMAVTDCAAVERRPSAPMMSTGQAAAAETPALDRQILVMLHAPAPHFRPDAGYAGSYQTVPGREARRRVARRLAREHDLQLLDDWPMPALGVDCFVMQLPADASLPTDTSRARLLQRLAADPRVAWVQAMHRFRLLGDSDPLYPVQPAAGRWRLAELHALAQGRDVVVAAMDTGVQAGHPDLRGQVTLARNFVDDAPPPAEAHGTEIAGIIAARADNGIGVAGIAPQARLLALRACWQRPDGAAACSSFTLAKAMQFALQADVQVLNLSLSGPHDALLARLLDAALARGITIVGAVDAREEDGGFPASHPGVLAVTGDRAESGIAGALLAPGQDIPTTTTGGGWRLVAGPSFAAAQVAGLAALLHELSPRISPARLRAALAPETALGLPARRPMSIDACAAVVRVSERCACDCAAARTASSMPRR
jgi:hypothetical protein